MDVSTKWIIKDKHLLLEREGKPPLLHSMLLEKGNDMPELSFSYWDYEAWIMSKFVNEKILLLGLGGATSLQILENLNIPPRKVVGVDIDADELKEKGLLNYSYLDVVNSDAYTYLKQTTEKFDLILVDVYNFEGYVENIYKDMELLNNTLCNGGMVAFHCLDPVIKYFSFNIKFNKLRPSTSIEIASLANDYFENVYISTLWTTSLVIAEKNSGTMLNKLNSKSDLLNPPYIWLDNFYKKRIYNYLELTNELTRFKYPMNYRFIEQEDDINLMSFFNVIRDTKFKEDFIEIFGDKNTNKVDSDIKIDHYSDINIESLFLLSSLLSNRKELLEKETINHIIERFKSLPKTKESQMTQSYVLAYSKNWDKAIALLKGIETIY